MMLCLDASGRTVALAIEAFTLIWSHSVEKTEWREDWRVGEKGLSIVQASVEGTGAGMEIPEGARREGNAWVYVPDMAPLEEVRFADAGLGSDWTICWNEQCHRMNSVIPTKGSGLVMRACTAAEGD
ncbi:DUF1850 domain-containing protein [Pararhizobium haloflavum]|uniref:DUF1850 domain-containing protein n=1 Tax=Pararhizobium haloflavum TaxID=2037914 RepID=UPI000C1753CF|nr:DUF1850 domain-containing protein [Pararhizobium haloflavum]